MRSPERRRIVVVTAVTAVLVIAAGGAMAEGGNGPSEVTVGEPWTGAPGIERTVSGIMAEQRAKSAVRTPRVIREHDADLHPVPSPTSPAGGPATRAALPGPKALTVGSSFTGATLAADSNFVPPDSMGAVGPTQFLVGVNGRIRVFSKTGTAGTLNATLDTFFGSVLTAGAFTTDPRVRYDPLSGKWFVTAIDTGDVNGVNNRVLLAVSSGATIDNSTVWTFFQFRQDLPGPTGDANDFADFDTLGVDANALYIGANIFDSAGHFVNTTAFVIRKSSVTGGGPIVVTAFRHLLDGSDNGPYTPQGVDNLDPAAGEGYFVGVDGAFFGIIDVRRVASPGGTPTLSGNLAVSVPNDDRLPISVPALGTTAKGGVDAVDWRLGTSSIRNGKLYTAQNIGVDSSGTGSGSPSRDAVRWYELANLTTTPTLSRSGTIFDGSGSNPLSYWMPSIAVNGQGHAVIGMSTGGAAARPNAAVSSMLSGDSSFSSPANYTSSSASYAPSFDSGNPLRWGDYSNTSVDPCDGQTFWTIQEYVDGTDSWGVKVAKLAAPPPATPASTSPSAVAAGQASVSVTLTGTSSAGSGFWDPGSGSCRIAASIDGGVTVNSVTFVDATHVTLDISTVGATTGARSVTITNPDGQTASAAVLNVDTAPANTALPTITGTAALGSALTATDGTWTGTPTPTLTRRWRRCDQSGASCADIGSATGTTYTAVQADVGSTIRVRVTGTNGVGSSSADSAQTAIVTGPPVAATPTISGSATVGQTLTANTGSWGGYPAPTFTYQWQRCDSGGLNCIDLPGATASTYTPVTADVGSTLRVKVTGTNVGGTAGPVSSAATSAVVPAPSGGGGGGGGGSGGLPDVVIAFSASPAAPAVGGTLVYTLTAAIKTGNASDVKATVNLPAQVSFGSASTNRGPGCTGTTTLTCDVDFLSGNLVAQVTIVTTVTATGTLTATASLTSTPTDTNAADNSATVVTTVAAPTPTPTPTPPAKKPLLKQLGSRTLSGVPHGPNESFATRFSTNEPMRLSMTVTRSRSSRKLALQKGSGLAGTTTGSARFTLAGVARGAGGFGLNAVLRRSGLVSGALYVVHLTAVDANGNKAALNVSFRAR